MHLLPRSCCCLNITTVKLAWKKLIVFVIDIQIRLSEKKDFLIRIKFGYKIVYLLTFLYLQ